MKNFYLLLFSFTSFIIHAQYGKGVDDKDFKIIYRLDYTKYVGFDKTANENQVLIVKNDRTSYFMFETMVALDSIQKTRNLNVADVMLYRSPLYYLIKRKEELVSHLELLGNDLVKFDEQVGFNWKLFNDNKIINGYNCKKATVSYEGREWTAWYTSEIPLNAGPYKFYDLPGLILDLSDAQSLFHFSVTSVETGYFNTNSNLSSYFITEGNNTIQDVEKKYFHSLRKKFHQMSMDESLKYQNRGEAGVYSARITTLTGEKVNTNRKPKTKNFIEKYD
jgi:GLPGLI family protein